MPTLNHHRKDFDDGTLTKLKIFENYLETWLPTFIHNKACREVYICDFFAGPGKDTSGTSGSPLIIIDIIGRYMEQLSQRGLKVHILLNELDRRKYNKLQLEVENLLPEISAIQDLISIKFENCDFDLLFGKIAKRLQREYCLFFLDQNGVKYMTVDRLHQLESFTHTDYLFFCASSYLRRFEFQDYFPGFYISEETRNEDVHRFLRDYYQERLGPNSKTMLYPFTIKKGNIYGLIFGTNHLRGADKFLRVVWGQNPLNGEANFDID